MLVAALWDNTSPAATTPLLAPGPGADGFGSVADTVHLHLRAGKAPGSATGGLFVRGTIFRHAVLQSAWNSEDRA